MNQKFPTYILFGNGDFDKKQTLAKQLGYTMFEFNTGVYSTSDGILLFKLNQLYV